MRDEIPRLFAERGLRCTRQRTAIFDALLATREHPTADELFHEVAPGPSPEGLSLATVYNTLEAFCAAGLVQKLPGAGENGSARYDALREDHLHLRDAATGRVRDAPASLSRRLLDHVPPDLLRELEQELGFRVNQVQIELVGRYAGSGGEAVTRRS